MLGHQAERIDGFFPRRLVKPFLCKKVGLKSIIFIRAGLLSGILCFALCDEWRHAVEVASRDYHAHQETHFQLKSPWAPRLVDSDRIKTTDVIEDIKLPINPASLSFPHTSKVQVKRPIIKLSYRSGMCSCWELLIHYPLNHSFRLIFPVKKEQRREDSI